MDAVSPGPSSPHDSQYSESNPLTADDPSVFFKNVGEPKKPQAVALHGWQRTVGVDDDYDPTIPVRLGAPGTGLAAAKVPPNGGATLGPGMGRAKLSRHQQDQDSAARRSKSVAALGAMVDLGNVTVTRQDKREAKSLRAQPPAPGAAPLPYPRVPEVESETDESSIEEDEEDDYDPTCQLGQKWQNRVETQSTASSDMSFLINTASGAVFNRPTFGRAIEPRIPSTVGEEQLHNSLAEFFGNRQKLAKSGGSESMGGEGRSSDIGRAGGSTGSLTSITALAKSANKADGLPGSANRTTLSMSGGSGKTAETSLSLASTFMVAPEEYQHVNSYFRGKSRETVEESEQEERQQSVEGDALVAATMAEEGRIGEQAGVGGGGEEAVEPGRRSPKCLFLRRWPWRKILSGAVPFAGAAVVVMAATSGCSLGSRRCLFSPPLLLPSSGRASSSDWPGGPAVVGVGGGGRSAVHSWRQSWRRISEDRVDAAVSTSSRGRHPVEGTQATGGSGGDDVAYGGGVIDRWRATEPTRRVGGPADGVDGAREGRRWRNGRNGRTATSTLDQERKEEDVSGVSTGSLVRV